MTGPNPEITPDPSGPPQGDSEARDALRDRIADALYQWTLSVAAPRSTRPPYLDPRTEERLRENSLARADALLPVVEAETAKAEQRYKGIAEGYAIEVRDLVGKLGQAEDILRIAHDTSNTSERERARAVQRAEQAEERLAHRHGEWQRELDARITAERQLQDATRRAEKAEAAIARVRGLAAAWRRVGKHGAADELDNALDQPEATP